MAAPLTAVEVTRLVGEATGRAGPFPGPVPFLANLELLLRSCRETATLNPTGEQVLHKSAVRHLRNLRYLQDFVATHPEVAGLPLGAPVVVTGLPRTGTTLLHNLLALDPAHRALRLWEALHPVPAPAGDTAASPDAPASGAIADRQAQAQRWLDGFYRLVPGFQAIHGATATGPEECDALLQNAFASQHFDDMFDATAYSSWLGGSALTAEYEHYALQLRALSLASPPGTRWALKSPGHLGHLDALLAVLPEAAVVVCHRQPREAVASYASLIDTLRRAYSDSVDAAALGRHALARAVAATERALDARAARPGTTFVDVPYARLVADPVGVLGNVYRALGRDLDAGMEEQLRAWVAAHPQHGPGPHRYDLARFGLHPDEVDAAFARYTEAFGALTTA